jgi:hypothetical protein
MLIKKMGGNQSANLGPQQTSDREINPDDVFIDYKLFVEYDVNELQTNSSGGSVYRETEFTSIREYEWNTYKSDSMFQREKVNEIFRTLFDTIHDSYYYVHNPSDEDSESREIQFDRIIIKKLFLTAINRPEKYAVSEQQKHIALVNYVTKLRTNSQNNPLSELMRMISAGMSAPMIYFEIIKKSDLDNMQFIFRGFPEFHGNALATVIKNAIKEKLPQVLPEVTVYGNFTCKVQTRVIEVKNDLVVFGPWSGEPSLKYDADENLPVLFRFLLVPASIRFPLVAERIVNDNLNVVEQKIQDARDEQSIQ